MKHSIKRFFLLTLISIVLLNALPIFATSKIPAVCAQDEKVVYLTFDDGPTPKITNQILDVLKKNHVKATFFIVGKEIKGREAILKRIYQEGHGIGLHTFSHNFKIIYKNTDSLIMEMEKTKATINEVLGTQLDIKAIRFPGGSAGRLSAKLYKSLNEKGYIIFDWNVDLKDGIKASLPPTQFVANSKKCRDTTNRRIILAHCNSNNKNTCTALDGIITYYKKQGYTFKAIDNSTSPYYFKFKK